MKVEWAEIEAGVGQMLVVYVNADLGDSPDPAEFVLEIAKDATARQGAGWSLMSVAGWPMRQTGTAGNVLFQSGGQFATQLTTIATYRKSA